MATSPASPGVIAQLSRGVRRTSNRGSAGPSPQRFAFEDNTGTGSSFQPEHESTQNFDTAAQSPEADLDLSDSIEVGRGVKRTARLSPNRYDYDISENPILSLGNDSLYELTATPPVHSGADYHKERAASNSLRKEASVRRASMAAQNEVTKAGDTVPQKARTTSASNRRTLSQMHAKVHAESDSSLFLDERPDAVNETKEKNTRFGRSRHVSAEQAIPTRFTVTGALDSTRTPRRSAPVADAAFTSQTAQSFMLPDLPNITELVSGVRKDGTPVFSKTSKNRSRFISASYGRGTNADITEHARLHSIPLPDEEKAIFASLQLLKEKVSQLEMEKSEATKKLEEYDGHIIDLRSQLQIERGTRRPDSAFGSDEESSAKDRWHTEKKSLQASLKANQERLERSERKVSVSDIAVRRITQERDNLVTQLGVAFYSNEELKDENEQLLSEIEGLHEASKDTGKHLARLRQGNADLVVQLAQVEAQRVEHAQVWKEKVDGLKARLSRREETVKEMRDITREIWEANKSNKEAPRSDDKKQKKSMFSHIEQETRSNIMDRVEQEVRKARAEASSRLKQNTSSANRRTLPNESRSRSRSKSRNRPTSSGASRNLSIPRLAKPDDLESIDSDGESTTDLVISKRAKDNKQPSLAADDDGQDITYLSFIDPLELANLRKKLEEERRAAKQGRRSSAPTVTEREVTTAFAASGPRKSSLRDVTAALDGTAMGIDGISAGLTRNVRIQSPHASDAIPYEEPDHTTSASMLSTVSRRPSGKSFEEMTSGFILPDITLHKGPMASGAGDIAHDKKTCTLCGTHEQDAPTPVPVTERDIDETQATIRPSQSPPVALATVLKQLQDEVTHLKIQLAAYERIYNTHDPAIGRRKRKALKAKIDTLLSEIEKRSEQIYALYDVLEGQKQQNTDAQTGAEADDETVEETLQSLGIDPKDLAKRAAKAKKASSKKMTGVRGLDELLADSDDDAAWDGLSDGIGSDGESADLGVQRMRRSVAA